MLIRPYVQVLVLVLVLVDVVFALVYRQTLAESVQLPALKDVSNSDK